MLIGVKDSQSDLEKHYKTFCGLYEKYIYKSLSCGENSYAGIHISNKGKKYAEVWVETEEDKGFLRDLYLCPEVIDYLVSNKWRDK